MLNIFLKFILALTVFCVFNPFIPIFPSDIPLDPSWVIGLNQAVSQNLKFGRDIIFTFGPYAAIYTKAFHPFTNSLELTGSVYLAGLYIAAILAVTRKTTLIIPIALSALFAGFTTHLDALFYSYALLVAIYCWQSLQIKQPLQPKNQLKHLFYLAILFSGFGLYPLIKGPLFVVYFPIAILTVILFIWERKWLAGFIIPLSIAVSISCFWLYGHQNISTLPDYFSNLIILISGFSQAMSINGDLWEVVGYLLISGLIGIYLVWKGGVNPKTAYLFLVFGLFLFAAFKAGFVRHDGHALISGNALMIAVILALVIYPMRIGYLLLILACTVFLKIEFHYKPQLTTSLFRQINNTYQSTWLGAQVRIFNPKQIQRQYEITLDSLNRKVPLPTLAGSSDIFPFDQTFLLASGNTWNPRPIFQSYHVYTESLAAKNLHFIQGPRAPENIFFRIESIDGRLPSGDDGAIWSTLLSQYLPSGFAGKYLILKRNVATSKTQELAPLSIKTYQMNHWVELPSNDQKIWAAIDLKQTWIGRIKALLYKSSTIGIALRLADGSEKQYRLIPGIARFNFLLSPLVLNVNEFESLYGDKNSLSGKQVKAISIWVEGSQRDWQKTYELSLTETR